MKKFYFLFIIALVAMMVSCKKEAEQTEEAAEPQATEEKEAIEGTQSAALNSMRLGQELALYGYENESAEALIEAANILMNIPTKQLEAEVEKSEGVGEQGEKTTPERSFNPTDLLTKAKEFAGEDATTLAMIKKSEDKLAALEASGRGNGEATTHVAQGRVESNGSYTFTLTCSNSHLAECAVVGDGDTDLDLYIYDVNGNLVVSDTRYDVNCYASWYPRYNGTFYAKIVNRGNVYNDFLFFLE